MNAPEAAWVGTVPRTQASLTSTWASAAPDASAVATAAIDAASVAARNLACIFVSPESRH
ncbi:hypothetical protein D9M73_232050 [compost metagenome]